MLRNKRFPAVIAATALTASAVMAPQVFAQGDQNQDQPDSDQTISETNSDTVSEEAGIDLPVEESVAGPDIKVSAPAPANEPVEIDAPPTGAATEAAPLLDDPLTFDADALTVDLLQDPQTIPLEEVGSIRFTYGEWTQADDGTWGRFVTIPVQQGGPNPWR